MSLATFTRALVALALVAGAAGCSSMGSTMSLFDRLGGMDGVKSLSNAFVNNVASDSRTGSMVSGANTTALKSKMSDQLCAMSGGGCNAPLTSAQIADAGKKVNATQSSALSESFSKALDTVKVAPGVKEGAAKLMGPQLGGILAGLM